MKQGKTVQKACDHLINKVRFKKAKFRLGTNRLSNDADTAAICEATRLYTETWVVPLLEAIRDGDIDRLRRALD